MPSRLPAAARWGRPVKQAGRAAWLLGRGDHALERDVAERVGADATRGSRRRPGPLAIELGAGGEVDAVEARPLHRRGGDAHVHLGRASLAQHPDEGALGVAADDRVVDDDEALARDDVRERVELEPDAELAQRLRRLDERASDVGVLGEALPNGMPDCLGVADRGRRARLGHGDDEVGLDGVLARPACGPSRRARRAPAAGDRGVGPRQVDVLEDAALGVRLGEALLRRPSRVDGDELARLDLADERGADDVERRGLAGHDPAALQPAEHQRADALRVPRGVQRRARP